MCQQLNRILVRQSRATSRRLKRRGVRQWARIVTACKHDIELTYGCKSNEQDGWSQHGSRQANWLPVEAWPDQVKQFLREQIMVKPKPKQKAPADKASKLNQRRAAAAKKLAEWTRKSTVASSRMRKYAKQLASIERQIAAQQSAGFAGAGRSFSFGEE
jgi:hypothetical protein